eukprot:Rhum_TRINITY_DN14529_c9_g1::Rhum_TRINITY_DN14529_c9_g1_i1::g.96861::m.96861
MRLSFLLPFDGSLVVFLRSLEHHADGAEPVHAFAHRHLHRHPVRPLACTLRDGAYNVQRDVDAGGRHGFVRLLVFGVVAAVALLRGGRGTPSEVGRGRRRHGGRRLAVVAAAVLGLIVVVVVVVVVVAVVVCAAAVRRRRRRRRRLPLGSAVRRRARRRLRHLDHNFRQVAGGRGFLDRRAAVQHLEVEHGDGRGARGVGRGTLNAVRAQVLHLPLLDRLLQVVRRRRAARSVRRRCRRVHGDGLLLARRRGCRGRLRGLGRRGRRRRGAAAGTQGILRVVYGAAAAEALLQHGTHALLGVAGEALRTAAHVHVLVRVLELHVLAAFSGGTGDDGPLRLAGDRESVAGRLRRRRRRLLACADAERVVVGVCAEVLLGLFLHVRRRHVRCHLVAQVQLVTGAATGAGARVAAGWVEEHGAAGRKVGGGARQLGRRGRRAQVRRVGRNPAVRQRARGVEESADVVVRLHGVVPHRLLLLLLRRARLRSGGGGGGRGTRGLHRRLPPQLVLAAVLVELAGCVRAARGVHVDARRQLAHVVAGHRHCADGGEKSLDALHALHLGVGEAVQVLLHVVRRHAHLRVDLARRRRRLKVVVYARVDGGGVQLLRGGTAGGRGDRLAGGVVQVAVLPLRCRRAVRRALRRVTLHLSAGAELLLQLLHLAPEGLRAGVLLHGTADLDGGLAAHVVRRGCGGLVLVLHEACLLDGADGGGRRLAGHAGNGRRQRRKVSLQDCAREL